MSQEKNGIILVTGATGSGKSTSLAAVLNDINENKSVHVVTLEDPVEYQHPHKKSTFNQREMGNDFDTFASGLRAALRQAPKVILVGEMRDEETAELGVRASLTGHLVLSTLHTNDAVGVILRLRDMNINNFLLSSSMLGIIAQRLVRKVCPYCKEEYTPDPKEAQDFDIPLGSTLFKGRGCTHCSNKGYLGRTVISEVMTISDEIARLIAEDVPPYKIEEAARREGMTTLREDAIAKVLQGITTLEEARRVVG